jgi:ClpP class serine protease
LFSGAYWTGQRGRELGLVDAIGDLRTTLRERYGDKVRTPLIAERGFALFGRKAAGVEQLLNRPNFAGLSIADDLVATLEARALWSRFGL